MNLNAQLMLKAFRCLDQMLSRPVRLIVGGGGAMLLAHNFPLSTSDVDGIPAAGVTVDELDPLVKKVAQELSFSPDWLNPYYASFSHVLPSDYGSRLITVCELKWLRVEALSKEDLLIMKCFAARQKDVIHARALVRGGARIEFVKKHIETLRKKNIPGAEKAQNFLSEIESFFKQRAEEE